MNTDPIADLLTRIRNASNSQHPTVTIPASKTKENILKVLVDEGYIAKYEAFKDASNLPFLKVYLRYDQQGQPIIRELKRVSSSGKRVYRGKEDVRPYRGGLGVMVLSTSNGMVSDREARKLGVGGEVVCTVF